MPHRHIQGNDLSPLSSQASEEVSRGQSSGFWRYNSHRFLPFHELTQILLWFHDTKEDEKEKKRIRLSQSRALQVLSRRLAGEMCSRLGASPSSCTRIKAWHPPVSDSTLGGPPYEVRDTCSLIRWTKKQWFCYEMIYVWFTQYRIERERSKTLAQSR